MIQKLGFFAAGLVAVVIANKPQHDWNFDDRKSFTIWAAPGRANVAFDCYTQCMNVTNPLIQQRADLGPVNETASTSAQACLELVSTRGFQRCYVSRCGGLSARSHNRVFSLQGWAWSVKYLSSGQTNLSGVDLPQWKPFPLGFTAACFEYVHKSKHAEDPEVELVVGTPAPLGMGLGNPTSASDLASSAKARLLSDENRFRLPTRLGRLILPIWRSSELDTLWDYNIYQGSTDIIEHPRSLSDLHKHLIGVYVTVLCAYAHYLSISSNKGVSIYRGIQLITYGVLPTIGAIQAAHNLVDAIIHCINGVGIGWGYLGAHLLGYQIYDQRIAIHASRLPLLDLSLTDVISTSNGLKDAKWYIRFIGVTINFIAFVFAALPYAVRLSYTHLGMTYCATTGFDHRAGWLALSAFIPLTGTLGLHSMNKTWKVQNLIAQPALTSQRPWNWPWRFSVDLFGATLLLNFLINLTGRNSLIGLLGGFIQRYITLILFIVGATLFAAWCCYSALQLLFSNPDRWPSKVVLGSALVGVIGYAISVFLWQIFLDMEEYADLALDFVFPWNYRWMQPAPGWLGWW